MTRREALAWSGVWIGLAIVFNIGVYAVRGSEAGLEWTTGYLVEKTLSIDNVFVILLLLSAFAVPAAYQRRLLFWGIVSALVMRAILIAAAGFCSAPCTSSSRLRCVSHLYRCPLPSGARS